MNGDIPKELVNPCAPSLARALTPIFNSCMLSKKWPTFWKVETIVPIPKTLSPGTMDDIRPISMTTLWSKLLESYIASFTLQETSKNWKDTQYGGRKGSSTDHVLVGIWDKILNGLDNNNKAVVLGGIDFSKSFSRCSHQEILKAYRDLGLSDWGIRMHAAFLTDRKMRVKIGNILSDEREITGGAVQGSVLGVLDHNAVMESVDGELVETDVFKYVDDLTLLETIDKEIPSMIDSTNERPTHSFKPPKVQEGFDKLSEMCKSRGLKINEQKTQLLSISSAKFNTSAWITQKNGTPIYSGDKLKLLGFTFSNKPDVHAQVDNLINRAASRAFVVRRLAGIKVDRTRLTRIYTSIVRSVLEYSSVTYGPMITKYDSNRIENIQKHCLRSILGFDKRYEDLLEESGLQTLEARRHNALKKFADKTSRNPQFSEWFQLNPNRSSQRSGKLYQEHHARSERLYNSPLYAMRRILNNTHNESRANNPIYQDLSHLFNLP